MNITRCLALALTALSLSSYANAAVVSAGDRLLPPGYRLNFISIGAGINDKAYKVVVKELQAQLAAGTLLEFTLDPYGFEGDRRLCFTLSSNVEAAAIIAKAKITGTETSMVGIESTQSCTEAP